MPAELEKTPEQICEELLQEQLKKFGTVDTQFLQALFEELSTEHINDVISVMLRYNFYAYCLVTPFDLGEITDHIPDTELTVFVTPTPVEAEILHYQQTLSQQPGRSLEEGSDPLVDLHTQLEQLKSQANVFITLEKKNSEK